MHRIRSDTHTDTRIRAQIRERIRADTHTDTRIRARIRGYAHGYADTHGYADGYADTRIRARIRGYAHGYARIRARIRGYANGYANGYGRIRADTRTDTRIRKMATHGYSHEYATFAHEYARIRGVNARNAPVTPVIVCVGGVRGELEGC